MKMLTTELGEIMDRHRALSEKILQNLRPSVGGKVDGEEVSIETFMDKMIPQLNYISMEMTWCGYVHPRAKEMFGRKMVKDWQMSITQEKVGEYVRVFAELIEQNLLEAKITEQGEVLDLPKEPKTCIGTDPLIVTVDVPRGSLLARKSEGVLTLSEMDLMVALRCRVPDAYSFIAAPYLALSLNHGELSKLPGLDMQRSELCYDTYIATLSR